MAFKFFNLGKVGIIHSFLKSNYFNESKLVYDQSHYFDLGPIPKPKPKLKKQLLANNVTNNKTKHNLLLKVKLKRVWISPNVMMMPTFNVTIRIRSASQSVSQPAQGNSGPGIYASDR